MANKKTTPKTRGWKRIKRNLITILIIGLLLYIGAHIISRLEGTRQIVADKLSNGTRQQISIEKCSMTPLMGLQIQNLSFQGVEMPEVTISFNWLAFLSKETPVVRELRIKGMEMRLRRVPTTGNWEPLVLNGIGSRVGAVLGLNPQKLETDDSLPQFPAYAINSKTLLQLEQAKIVWKDKNGRDIAYITDANLQLKSGNFIKRKVIQTLFSCGHLKLASGRTLREFQMEAFRVEGSEIITVLNMADSNGQYAEFSSATLWQDL
ncbi:MAG: hypothetical protein V5783_08390, partial [Pontiella sp.]